VAVFPLATVEERADPEAAPKLKSAPVPVNVTVCGLPLALSAIVNDPLRAAAAVGVKTIVNVHEALAARLMPQLLVWE